ncbi:uncharacterized protein BO96DRAFT_12451 [Aspergillus niger CBS 101883]|uniref:uncharacterized protein n=1 Tax=Aspergillus lacticoffeatus (strain CBS 101883) TaxID=1450533 RepID=UPI000D7ECF67|nr:uncharacterized protein BO96DRAFT_12451 [Aspergillus niger CBS 101883]PYH62341.1 hypothetical protein BO96DRAFT_12451 [Aspergillus niger CBS 101883]
MQELWTGLSVLMAPCLAMASLGAYISGTSVGSSTYMHCLIAAIEHRCEPTEM